MMLVGRKARGYNGYPEPDLNRPPMAAYRQEGRPSSGHGSSGYGVLPPAGRSMAGESGFYDDRSYHAAAAGLGGARITSTYGGGHGVAGGSGESYTQLSNGKFVATGRRDGDMMPIQTSYHTPEAEGDSPRGSMVLDSYEMERERELDLQQQERMLSLSGGEPVHVAGDDVDKGEQERLPGLSSEKQEFEEAQQPQHPDTNMSNLSQESRSDSPPPQTLTSATNSIKSKNSIEPLHHGRSSHLKQVNTISEVLPSMGVGELSGAGAEKEEYLQDQPSTTEPAEDHTPNAEESVASPPPLPMSTKPRS
ncbi:hypothetical protein BGZ58_008937 [Dissophora ornata]|nr:hypothetical protein BGZ58_008937 [Dissophora ornata]